MYIVRDIFHLKFGHYRPAKELLDEAFKNELMPNIPGGRILTDFTGDAYRLIFELPFNSLAEYEQTLTGNLSQEAWQDWYKKFRSHVKSSHREILKQVK
jgi:hypothetical protein